MKLEISTHQVLHQLCIYLKIEDQAIWVTIIAIFQQFPSFKLEKHDIISKTTQKIN